MASFAVDPWDKPDTSPCPKCNKEVENFDGHILRHQECGYCAHPSLTGSTCEVCGHMMLTDLGMTADQLVDWHERVGIICTHHFREDPGGPSTSEAERMATEMILGVP